MPENVERYDDETDLRAYLEVLWRRKWVIVALVGLAAMAAYGFTRSMEPVYEAEATVLVRTDTPGLGVVEAQRSTPVLSVDTALEMLQSRQLAQAAAEELMAAGVLRGADLEESDGGTWVLKRISTQRVGNTPMLRIRAEATTPETASAVANAVVHTLEQAMVEATQNDLRAASTFTADQLERVRRDLAALESATASGRAMTEIELQRERRVLEDLYANLLRQQEEVRMHLAVQSSPLQVIDAAIPPMAPVRPRMSLNLSVGVVLGGFMGLAFVFVLEFFDVRVRNPRQIGEIVGAPILAQIPRERASDAHAADAAARTGLAAWDEGTERPARVDRRSGGRDDALEPAGYGLGAGERAMAGEGHGHESR